MLTKPRIRTPKLAVDAIVDYRGKIILIRRKNPPLGWALPGGFVDVGESVEAAVRRELMEEAGVELLDLRQFKVYSDPKRDPRFHVVSVVFTAKSGVAPKAGSDASRVDLFALDEIMGLMNKKNKLCFDHERIMSDYFYASGKSSVL